MVSDLVPAFKVTTSSWLYGCNVWLRSFSVHCTAKALLTYCRTAIGLGCWETSCDGRSISSLPSFHSPVRFTATCHKYLSSLSHSLCLFLPLCARFFSLLFPITPRADSCPLPHGFCCIKRELFPPAVAKCCSYSPWIIYLFCLFVCWFWFFLFLLFVFLCLLLSHIVYMTVTLQHKTPLLKSFSENKKNWITAEN